MKAIPVLTVLILTMFSYAVFAQQNQASPEISETLRKKDSLLFDAALHTQNRKQLESVLAPGFTYHQDNGGIAYSQSQSRSEFILNIEKSWQKKDRKVLRVVAPGTLQAFMLNANEVLQTGTQQFYLTKSAQKERLVEVSRFTRTWQKEKGEWKLAREFDALNTQTEAQENTELYDEIVRMDSLYFNTYNTCDLKKMRSLMSDHLEFYHDKGGLDTSVTNVIASIEKNICGKVTRTLVPGSIEVYPIANYGAVEIGYHRFINKAEGNHVSRPGKFIIIWQKTKDSWVITRVVSLH